MAKAAENSGKYSLEYRLTHLFLFFAASDGVLSEPEITKTAVYIKAMLEKIGSKTDLKELLLACLEDMKNNGNVEALKETIGIFAQHMPVDILKIIVSGIEDAASADGLSEKEAETLAYLKTDWGLA